MNLTVKRVWRDIQGSPLATATSIGATSVVVEEVVDFDEDGGDFVIGVDSGTYTGYDEDTNTVEGLSPALTVAHPKGTFLQDGLEPRGPKYADGYIDDQDSVTESVLIPSHLRKYYAVGGREDHEMEVAEVGLRPDGSLVILDGPKDEDRADGPVVFTWSLSGNVSVGTRPHRFSMPFGGSIEEVHIAMGTGGAPTGDDIIVDILKGGASILGTKLIVPAGDLSSDHVEPTTKEVSKNNIIQVEFEQVGSTLPGSDPTLYMTVFPSETAISGRIEVEGPQGEAGAAGADGVITEVQNEGVALADQPIMNFTGAGVDVTVAGGKYVVDVSGGGGGATDLPDLTDVDDATVPSTAGHVLRANGTAWVNSAIQDADLPSTIARDSELHNRSHAIDSTSDHTVSGGTSGHVLRQTGATTFAWGAIQDGDLPSTIARDSEVTTATAFRGARAYASAIQTLTTATLTAVDLDTESFDSDAFHDNVTNNTRFTVPAGKGGKYVLTGSVTFGPNTTGGRDVFWRKNGVTFISRAILPPATGGAATSVPIADTVDLAAGDYVEMIARQTSGGDLNLAAGESQTYASVAFLGA